MFQNPEQAFGGTAPLLETIESIYAAAQKPALWGPVLDRICATLHGESIAIYAGFPDSRTPGIIAMSDLAPDVWNVFAGYYAAINPMMARAEEKFAVEETWFSHLAISDAELEHSEFYADFYKPNQMHHTVGLRIQLGDSASASLSCQRSSARGPFDNATDIICQTLRPHLQRALMLHHQMGTLQFAALGLDAALCAHDHAVIGIDRNLRIVMFNRGAEALLQAGDGIRSVNDRLACARPSEHNALVALLSATVACGVHSAAAAGGSLQVHRREPSPPLTLSVSPFHSTLPGRSAPLAALVFLIDASAPVRSRAATMRAIYGLTPTESRIADLLLQGMEIRGISGHLGTTLETARFHVKRILTKTGSRRQSELVRRMLALPSQSEQ